VAEIIVLATAAVSRWLGVVGKAEAIGKQCGGCIGNKSWVYLDLMNVMLKQSASSGLTMA
jgi:hypothetical protein